MDRIRSKFNDLSSWQSLALSTLGGPLGILYETKRQFIDPVKLETRRAAQAQDDQDLALRQAMEQASAVDKGSMEMAGKRRAQRQRALLLGGRRGTILTGSLGLMDTGLGEQKTLLGM